jgi:hypothetical protein
MKLLRYNKFLYVLLAVFLLISCNKWESNINDDPNSPPSTISTTSKSTDYEPQQFMSDMLWLTIHGLDYCYWNVVAAVCEYHGKTLSLSQGNRHQAWHAFDDSNDGGPWTNCYLDAAKIKAMRSVAKAVNDKRYIAVADIWECYTFFCLTNLYGPIPYSETMAASSTITPVYDSQKSIYFALTAKLKAAGLAIESNASAIDASTDAIFSGDMLKWKKFANTMLIRYAMYMYAAAPDSAVAVLNEIVADPTTYPVMTSNDDNALYHYSGISPYSSQLYKLSKSKIEEAPFSNIFIERLVSLKDPRLPIYARPVEKVHSDSTLNVLPHNSGTAKYAGHIYGICSDNSYAGAWNEGVNYASKLGYYFRTEDASGNATSASATHPMALAIYSEMLFFLAEARENGLITTGTAKAYYEDAIKASFDQYGASFTSTDYTSAFASADRLSSADIYLSQPDVSYNGSRDKLTLIAEQKWIASFLLSWEPYFDHRRTMLPKFRASSGAEAYVNTGSGTKFPSRADYPTSEASTNETNYNTARASGFNEAITSDANKNTVLMWLLQPKGTTWLQMPIFSEPSYSGAEYPVVSGNSAYPGTNFKTWYDSNWNSMFPWKNNDLK